MDGWVWEGGAGWDSLQVKLSIAIRIYRLF